MAARLEINMEFNDDLKPIETQETNPEEKIKPEKPTVSYSVMGVNEGKFGMLTKRE